MIGPWYITDTAIRKYLAIVGRPDTAAERDRAGVELERMATETLASGRAPKHLTQWTLQYRGPAPLRLRLIVSTRARPEGPRAQLVDVRPEHDRASKMGPRPAEAERGSVARQSRSAAMGPAPKREPEGRATAQGEQTPRPRSSGPSGATPNQEERRARNLPVNVTIALYPHEIDALDEQARGAGLSRARYVAGLILAVSSSAARAPTPPHRSRSGSK